MVTKKQPNVSALVNKCNKSERKSSAHTAYPYPHTYWTVYIKLNKSKQYFYDLSACGVCMCTLYFTVAIGICSARILIILLFRCRSLAPSFSCRVFYFPIYKSVWLFCVRHLKIWHFKIHACVCGVFCFALLFGRCLWKRKYNKKREHSLGLLHLFFRFGCLCWTSLRFCIPKNRRALNSDTTGTVIWRCLLIFSFSHF